MVPASQTSEMDSVLPREEGIILADRRGTLPQDRVRGSGGEGTGHEVFMNPCTLRPPGRKRGDRGTQSPVVGGRGFVDLPPGLHG
jgi:hypothetical protein